jgi:hypothetical protein
MWQDVNLLPATAGRYLVANSDAQEVGMARFQPRKGEWKFPSAQQAFAVTHWDYPPKPPATPNVELTGLAPVL